MALQTLYMIPKGYVFELDVDYGGIPPDIVKLRVKQPLRTVLSYDESFGFGQFCKMFIGWKWRLDQIDLEEFGCGKNITEAKKDMCDNICYCWGVYVRGDESELDESDIEYRTILMKHFEEVY